GCGTASTPGRLARTPRTCVTGSGRTEATASVAAAATAVVALAVAVPTPAAAAAEPRATADVQVISGSGGHLAVAPVAQLGTARYQHTSTLLADGRVLVAGGVGQDGRRTAGAELFDPRAGTWQTAASMG